MRNTEKADFFLSIASSYGLLSKDELGRLAVVECDLEKEETVGPAIGNAAKVRWFGKGGAGAGGVAVAAGMGRSSKLSVWSSVRR